MGFRFDQWVFSWRMTKESLEGETSFSSGGFFLLRGDERVVLEICFYSFFFFLVDERVLLYNHLFLFHTFLRLLCLFVVAM